MYSTTGIRRNRIYAYGKGKNIGRRGGINRSKGNDELARGIMGYRAMQGDGGYQNRTGGQRINPRLMGDI
jgi:hypothetical protein